jgi:transcriptional regulator with XRE-family HTH domain
MHIRNARELGALARDRRRELGWSQTELAQRLGTSRSWVSEAENGKGGAEVGLFLNALQVLGLVVDVQQPNLRRPAPSTSGTGPTSSSLAELTEAGERLNARPSLTRGGKRLSAARRG